MERKSNIPNSTFSAQRRRVLLGALALTGIAYTAPMLLTVNEVRASSGSRDYDRGSRRSYHRDQGSRGSRGSRASRGWGYRDPRPGRREEPRTIINDLLGM